MPPGKWRAELSWGHSEGLSPSLGGPGPQVIGCSPTLQGAVEPMQIDVDPQEDPQNAPDVNYVVENPTLVGGCRVLAAEGGGAWASAPLAGPGQALHAGCFPLAQKPTGFLTAHVRWLLAQLGTLHPTPPRREGPMCRVPCRLSSGQARASSGPRS